MNIALMNVQIMVRIRGYKVKGLPFLFGFVVTVIIFVVIFDQVGIEFNDKIMIAILGFGLMVGGFISMWRRGILHQGHFQIVTGLIFLFVGLVFFAGSFDVPMKDENGNIILHEKFWKLTPQESGVFLLLAIVGFFSLVSGIKLSWSNQYFWGSRR